ncbi:hypothetical protein, partial [Morganella morganii]|uniref:hypothetical protein n=1 Tax=Morganella morganii TaxID=582 RepID=UPI0034D3EF80
MKSYYKYRKFISYIILFFQFYFPTAVSFSAVAYASEVTEVGVGTDDMMNTMAGIQALINDNGADFLSSQTAQPIDSKMLTKNVLGSLSSDTYENIIRQDDILSALPTLGLPDSPTENSDDPLTGVAVGVSQAGQLLSADDAVDAS